MAESKRLIASIHDVGPRFEAQVDALADRLTALLGGERFAMLVVPNHWGEAPLSADKAFQAKLRRWAEAGVEMFVHGWFHKDLAEHKGLTGFKARHMTASEGEFLGLSQTEAAQRMRDGRALIEDIIGKPVAGFIAPAWLYGPGAKVALAECGFALAEDHMRVWKPASGEIISKSPVITWASRSKARIASSLAFSAIARATLDGMRDIRIAVHPGDVTVPALLDSIDKTCRRFAKGRSISHYADLIA